MLWTMSMRRRWLDAQEVAAQRLVLVTAVPDGQPGLELRVVQHVAVDDRCAQREQLHVELGVGRELGCELGEHPRDASVRLHREDLLVVGNPHPMSLWVGLE